MSYTSYTCRIDKSEGKRGRDRDRKTDMQSDTHTEGGGEEEALLYFFSAWEALLTFRRGKKSERL